MLQARERAPILSPSVVFTFGLIVDSIKELGGASMESFLMIKSNERMKKKRTKEGPIKKETSKPCL
jgi:hypothetical protein